ncbi:class I SAM-dependent methyltransferase [Bacillus marinisedimentorum]|uniref:class I SAM-dependent methyltransferase n=1 Tax=Bacillus marinisedimentorum TaxID=1821260 RepID=UPI0007E15419|nr:class I SAM-dependent methyltransferase [Bacillus marinisedimentorum]
MKIVGDSSLNIKLLKQISSKPPLFAKGEPLFWNDPHISKQMLEAHLHPDWEAASKQHATIDQEVEWLTEYLNLQQRDRVLDLGCGPGLYSRRFHQKGLDVTGIDYSQNSIAYAKKDAEAKSFSIEYIYQDYLKIDYEEAFDAIFLIYYDIGALTNAERDLLLEKVHRALKPGGSFVFDVISSHPRNVKPLQSSFRIHETGFWRDGCHMELAETFHYPEEDTFLDQTIIVDEIGDTKLYRVWEHQYSEETIRPVLEEKGFKIESLWDGLAGNEISGDARALGIVARKDE